MGRPLTAPHSGRPPTRAAGESRSIGNPIVCDECFRPYRRLAVRVLARAVLDVMDPAGSSTHRKSAQAFLTGSVMLRHWCHVAALDPDRIAQYVTRFTAGPALVPQDMQETDALRHPCQKLNSEAISMCRWLMRTHVCVLTTVRIRILHSRHNRVMSWFLGDPFCHHQPGYGRASRSWM